MRCIIRPLLFFQSIFYVITGELSSLFHPHFGDSLPKLQQHWSQHSFPCTVFPSGAGLLIWSIIYGLEHFDGWDGSELSCIAVANIVIGNTLVL